MTRDKALSILGLDLKATPADIKSAYRRLALANHPDKKGSAELFKLVQEAYETLEATVKADADRRKAEHAEVKRREARQKAAEHIAELQRKISEATKAKRKAEVEYSEAIINSYGLRDDHGLKEGALKTLDEAVETEAQFRVELIHKTAVFKGGKWTDYTEQPAIAKEVITAEWESMPKFKHENDWDFSQYVNATVAIEGKPDNDDNRRILAGIISGMFDYGITDLVEGRIELTNQDFRAGGFFVWGEYLALGGYHKLAINHYNSALRIKPNVWQIYYWRGYANIELGYYVEAINDFRAGIECASKHNQEAIVQLHTGIEMAREKANSHRPS